MADAALYQEYQREYFLSNHNQDMRSVYMTYEGWLEYTLKNTRKEIRSAIKNLNEALL